MNDPTISEAATGISSKSDKHGFSPPSTQTAQPARFSDLQIVEVPDDVKVQIEEYDGMEHVAEQHRTW